MQITENTAMPVRSPGLPVSAVDADAVGQGQYLILTLSGEAFAIGILAIKEIIEYGTLTEVPMMPEAVRGVINLRGAVVPVIDLSARFGRAPTAVAKRTCIVIVELSDGAEQHDVGLIVDSVNEVIDIAASEIEPAPSFGSKIRTDFIAGMGKVGGKFVIILDIERVLSLKNLVELQAAAHTTVVPEALTGCAA